MSVRIICPECGEVVEYSFGSFRCEHCGWLLSEPEFEDVLDEKTLQEVRMEEDWLAYSKLQENNENKKPTRSLWLRLGANIEITLEEERNIFSGNKELANKTLVKIIKNGRFIPLGDSYIPKEVVDFFNAQYKTKYESSDIDFCM